MDIIIPIITFIIGLIIGALIGIYYLRKKMQGLSMDDKQMQQMARQMGVNLNKKQLNQVNRMMKNANEKKK